MQADEFKSHHKDDNGERSGKHFPEFAVSLFTPGETGQVDVNAPHTLDTPPNTRRKAREVVDATGGNCTIAGHGPDGVVWEG